MTQRLATIDENNQIHFEGKSYQLVLERVTGSRLYGTHYELGEHPFDPDYVSDYDTRGIFVAPATDFLPLFQQVPTSLKIENRSDCEVYEVRNFLMMASKSNPNIMDILFGSTNSLVHSTPIGQKIYEKRHIFISNQAEKSFSSYAMSQLYRMKQHYRWNNEFPEIHEVHDALKLAFNNQEIDFQFIADYFSGDLAKNVTGQDANGKSHISFPLTLTQFKEKYLPNINLGKFLKPHMFKFMTFKTPFNKKIDNIDPVAVFNQLNSSATFSMLNDSMAYIYVTEGLDSMFTREGTFKTINKMAKVSSDLEPTFLATINHKQYKKSVDDVLAMWEWKCERNEKRAALERRFGYDVKHGMHLMRLLLSAKSLLLTGDYKPELSGEMLSLAKSILAGGLSYDDLIQQAESLHKELDHIVKSGQSKLPAEPDKEAIEQLLVDIYKMV